MVREPSDRPMPAQDTVISNEHKLLRHARPGEDLSVVFERLLQWAIAHTELGAHILRPESVAEEHLARRRFQESLEAGRHIITTCKNARSTWAGPSPATSISAGPDVMRNAGGDTPGTHLGLAPVPVPAARRDGMLPLSGSMRFGGDPLLGMPQNRALNIPEDLAKRRHNLSPSRSYSKKKASF